MAPRSKKQENIDSGSAKKTRQPQRRKAPEEISASSRSNIIDPSTKRDIAGVALLMLALILFLIAMIPTNDALVTNFASEWLHKIFGIGCYILPVLLICIGATFLYRSHPELLSSKVALGLTIIFISVLGFISLFAPIQSLGKDDPSLLFLDGSLSSHGGYIGAAIAWCGITLFGRMVTGVILVGVMIIGVIIIGFSISSVVELIRKKKNEHELRQAAKDLDPTSSRLGGRRRSVQPDAEIRLGRAGALGDVDLCDLPAAADGITRPLGSFSKQDKNAPRPRASSLRKLGSSPKPISPLDQVRVVDTASSSVISSQKTQPLEPLLAFDPNTGEVVDDVVISKLNDKIEESHNDVEYYDEVGSDSFDLPVIGAASEKLISSDDDLDPTEDFSPVTSEMVASADLDDCEEHEDREEQSSRKRGWLELEDDESSPADIEEDILIPSFLGRKYGQIDIETVASSYDSVLHIDFSHDPKAAFLAADQLMEEFEGDEASFEDQEVQEVQVAQEVQDIQDTQVVESAASDGEIVLELPDIAKDDLHLDNVMDSDESDMVDLDETFIEDDKAILNLPKIEIEDTQEQKESEPVSSASGAKKANTALNATPTTASQAKKEVAKPIPQAPCDGVYHLPPMSLLKASKRRGRANTSGNELRKTAERLHQTLVDFGIDAEVVGWIAGPTVTLFKVDLPAGVRVSRITALNDDIALALAAPGVRIFAPIPGTNYVGIEVPNEVRETVLLSDVIEDAEDGPLQIAIGKDVEGNSIVSDLAKMPHLLIGGTTGSGKSVSINAMIMSIIMRATPDEVRFIMIDPKRVEFTPYNGIPHLYIPVVTEPKEAATALSWGVAEMERRLKLFSKHGARNITQYNSKIERGDIEEEDSVTPGKLPYIVIIIDELADLMMNVGKEVEFSISRIAQLARAAGIHLIVATQRPSTNVVTGLIKANITNRIAFNVASGIDSRVILDTPGAENLIGLGDLLLSKPELAKPQRIQGCFISEEEIEAVVDWVKSQSEPEYHSEILKVNTITIGNTATNPTDLSDDDPLLWEAADIVVSGKAGSTSGIQRRLKVGYARAGRIMDQLEEKGIVGPSNGSKPREVLVDELELETLKAFELECA